jgi:hypothetical protein
MMKLGWTLGGDKTAGVTLAKGYLLEGERISSFEHG